MTKNKIKMGRPKISEEKAKSVVFQVRISKTEHEAICKASLKSGLKESQWARKVLLKSAKNKTAIITGHPANQGDRQ